MTVIAYRDGVLAGDSLWTDDSTVVASQSKILRLPDGALYGAAGDADDRALVAELENGNGLPSLEFLADTKVQIEALVIGPSGTPFLINYGGENPGVVCLRAPFAAVGTGKLLALGAMGHGATAEEAVHVACQFDIYCRPPIVMLQLS